MRCGVGRGRGFVGWLGLLLVVAAPARAQLDDALALQIEAISRLKDTDLEANPAVKAAVVRVLDKVRGRAEFVMLVRDFQWHDRDAELVEYAAAHPAEAAGVEAVRWLLEPGADPALLKRGLASPATAAGLVAALANSADRRAVPHLATLLAPVAPSAASGSVPADASVPAGAAERRAAVRGLARTQEGARVLIDLARAGKLPAELVLLATGELQQARWEDIRQAAAAVLPPLQTGQAEPLPPLAELLKRAGNPERGAAVYRRDTVGCLGCHQVRGEGVDFGPNLSEIGTKLGKDALFESILDPSAGISFGYEAWQIDLQNDEELFGLVISESAEELAIKAQTGIVRRVRKAEIRKRTQQKLSIMPTGLQQTMSVQELVDLVEYLAGLKKPAP